VAQLQTKNAARTPGDEPFHDWYSFVLSYEPRVVRALVKLLDVRRGSTVLDPFVGTGTTLIECRRRGITSIGVDANPFAVFASQVKTNWHIDPASLKKASSWFLSNLERDLHSASTPPPSDGLPQMFPRHWFSPAALRDVQILKQVCETAQPSSVRRLLQLLSTWVVVRRLARIKFGPEVYRIKKRRPIQLFPALEAKVSKALADLQEAGKWGAMPSARVLLGDSRQIDTLLDTQVDFVISSPPYPNEKDYTRNTRVELCLLDFVRTRDDLLEIKKRMIRSNTKNIYVTDHDGLLVQDFLPVRRIIKAIKGESVRRQVDHGFGRYYPRVVEEYFGGMYRFLTSLRSVLKRSGICALVVGDQMSFFQVPIPTGRILAQLAADLGYSVKGRILIRHRRSTLHPTPLREEILLLHNNARVSSARDS